MFAQKMRVMRSMFWGIRRIWERDIKKKIIGEI
jgi:hypothetical protein